MTPVPPIVSICLQAARSERSRDRLPVRGEEAAPVLGPGGLACGVLQRGHADRMAASKLIGQRVDLIEWEAQF
jgi:hypothetical protein